jgi:hypothetical protein
MSEPCCYELSSEISKKLDLQIQIDVNINLECF